MCRWRATSRGFTLAEILISVFLLAVAVLGLIGVRLYAARAAGAVPYRQTASLIAASKMAEIEHRLRGSESYLEVAEPRTQDPEHPRFNYEVLTDFDAGLKLVSVDVVVRWEDRERPGEYKLHTRFNEL